MKITSILLPLSLILLFLACGPKPKMDELQLNAGSRWTINQEMMPHLISSRKLVSDFSAEDFTSYQTLAKELAENNKLLISSCNMKGAAHDELHKWLHPYMVMINELSEAKNEETAKEVYAKIKEAYNTFDKYFK
jgi:hypothetical protein